MGFDSATEKRPFSAAGTEAAKAAAEGVEDGGAHRGVERSA